MTGAVGSGAPEGQRCVLVLPTTGEYDSRTRALDAADAIAARLG